MTAKTTAPTPGVTARRRSIDGFFRISERGSSVGREVRGGFATFFTMAYIVVLNPIVLGAGADMYGNHLDTGQLAAATAIVAAMMTVIMGLVGNVPLAIAAGLGLNGVLAFQIAPQMSWPDAMGLVVIEGIAICVLVVTGLRQAIMDAIPLALKKAISVGIGLFIAFIGFVDAGFVTRIPDAAHSTVPVQLGLNSKLVGWPVLIFALGVLLTLVLMARKVRGAILISIIAATVVAIVVNSVANVGADAWGLVQPTLPDTVASLPDLSLLGNASVLGGFAHAGIITAIVFVFTLVLSDFFDTMGTVIGVSSEAGLVDEDGRLPGIGRILLVDGAAAVAGGLGSCSSNTTFVESAAGVGEGARTGFANVVTGLLFAAALFLTPLTRVVPSQAAAPALVAVGFLLMTQVKDIEWADADVAIPAFLMIVLMPFTYSITNGLGAGFIAYVVIKAARGRWREPGWLLWLIAILFAAYFFLDPIERALGVS